MKDKEVEKVGGGREARKERKRERICPSGDIVPFNKASTFRLLEPVNKKARVPRICQKCVVYPLEHSQSFCVKSNLYIYHYFFFLLQKKVLFRYVEVFV